MSDKRKVALDKYTVPELWGLVACLQTDHGKTGDEWYLTEADRVLTEIDVRQKAA